MNKIVEFLRDVKIELARVSWPTKKETTQYTVTVIVMSLVVAGFLALWDLIFVKILNKII